jgi:hypothetical protein
VTGSRPLVVNKYTSITTTRLKMEVEQIP